MSKTLDTAAPTESGAPPVLPSEPALRSASATTSREPVARLFGERLDWWGPWRSVRSLLAGVPAFCVAVGLGAAALALVLAPEHGIGPALGSGVKLGLAAWLLYSLADVCLALVRGAPVEASEPHAVASPAYRPRVTAWWVAAAGALLIAAALQRSLARFVTNLLGYALVAIPLLWVVQRRAGPAAATRAAVAFAIFAFFPTHLDVPRPVITEQSRPDSAFRWSVAWPAENWVLRYELQLSRGLTEPLQVQFFLAQPYSGDSKIYVTVNGTDLGPARQIDGTALGFEVPVALVSSPGRLTFDLRQRPIDQRLLLIAQPWSAGASLGAAASSFSDGERWWKGTFNTARGRRQAGIYVVRVSSP